MSEIFSFLFAASAWVIPVLIAITFHEAAHGYVAWKLGDDTAKRMGRVSFNPFVHIDNFGTIILPAFLIITSMLATGRPFAFGYAKPVPVNFARLRMPRRDMVLVALAGPGINILLAAISAMLLNLLVYFPMSLAGWFGDMLIKSLFLNLILAVFNMIPLPPLDGGRVAVGLLPYSLASPLARLERHGMLILIGLLFILPLVGNQLGLNLSIFHWLVLPPVDFLSGLFLGWFSPLKL